MGDSIELTRRELLNTVHTYLEELGRENEHSRAFRIHEAGGVAPFLERSESALEAALQAVRAGEAAPM